MKLAHGPGIEVDWSTEQAKRLRDVQSRERSSGLVIQHSLVGSLRRKQIDACHGLSDGEVSALIARLKDEGMSL